MALLSPYYMASPLLPPAVAAKPAKDQANYLAWQHCWLHWRAGMLLLVASVCIFFVLAPYLPFGRPTTLLQAAGILLLSCLYLGVASGIVGLVRVPLMQRLFERALVRPPSYRRILLPGTALLFMLPIALLYLLLLRLNNAPGDESAGYILRWLVGPSLPWLIGSLWATQKLWKLNRPS